ncbi:MAG: ABC transporter permease [Alphaproteobacteria bacterium]|nr:ABC transporter permease [Alphaproteobacteria bacterium]
MLTYAAKRLGLALLVALAVSVISFALLRASSDVAAAVAGEAATAADIEFIRHAYGFDRPLVVQYFDWLGRTLTGDLGQSLYYKKDVADIVLSKLPVTLVLGAVSLVFAILLSIPLGVLAAVYPNTWIDRVSLFFAVIGQALPSFWFALVLIMLFSLTLRWLPVSGSDTWAHFVMPSIALGYYAAPAFMRLTRAGMMEVLSADFVRTARAKGLSPASVVFKHALRNAIIPVVALAAVQLGFMLGGSIVIETVFALDGLGYLAWQSIRHNDFPVTQAIVLLLSVLYIALTLLADLLNGWLDPRIRVR